MRRWNSSLGVGAGGGTNYPLDSANAAMCPLPSTPGLLPPTDGTETRVVTAPIAEPPTAERIQQVIASGQIVAVYQPIYRLAGRQIVGYEALARFPDFPEHRVEQWFEQAAEFGLSVPLELAAIHAALSASPHQATGAWLAVNSSPVTLTSSRLRTLLDSYDLNQIVLEVTEHTPIVDHERITDAIEPLRKSGAKLAVDDFGSGYASLHHILALAPDIVKLDVALTHQLGSDPTRRALIRALVGFAAEIDMLIIAEGIETQAQLEQLAQLGVTHGQGHYLARPAPRAHVTPGSLPSGHRNPGSPLGLSCSEAAAALGVSLGTVRRWSDMGYLRSSRTPGRQRRFSEEEIDRFVHSLKKQTETTAQRVAS
jgi:excisionase family DNA binding protein